MFYFFKRWLTGSLYWNFLHATLKIIQHFKKIFWEEFLKKKKTCVEILKHCNWETHFHWRLTPSVNLTFTLVLQKNSYLLLTDVFSYCHRKSQVNPNWNVSWTFFEHNLVCVISAEFPNFLTMLLGFWDFKNSSFLQKIPEVLKIGIFVRECFL